MSSDPQSEMPPSDDVASAEDAATKETAGAADAPPAAEVSASDGLGDGEANAGDAVVAGDEVGDVGDEAGGKGKASGDGGEDGEEAAEPEIDEAALAAAEAEWEDIDDDDPDMDVKPLMELEDESQTDHSYDWYILKVQVNRETSIRDNLERRVNMHGMESLFHDIVVPTEDVVEFTKSGKKRIVKKKLYPGYILVNMAVTDESRLLIRETNGVGDFTGGKPTPMDPVEVERIIRKPTEEDDEPEGPAIDMPFKVGDKVRVKDGNFQNFEGSVDAIDEAHGKVTVEIEMFGRPTPVQLEHWQVETVD